MVKVDVSSSSGSESSDSEVEIVGQIQSASEYSDDSAAEEFAKATRSVKKQPRKTTRKSTKASAASARTSKAPAKSKGRPKTKAKNSLSGNSNATSTTPNTTTASASASAATTGTKRKRDGPSEASRKAHAAATGRLKMIQDAAKKAPEVAAADKDNSLVSPPKPVEKSHRWTFQGVDVALKKLECAMEGCDNLALAEIPCECNFCRDESGFNYICFDCSTDPEKGLFCPNGAPQGRPLYNYEYIQHVSQASKSLVEMVPNLLPKFGFEKCVCSEIVPKGNMNEHKRNCQMHWECSCKTITLACDMEKHQSTCDHYYLCGCGEFVLKTQEDDHKKDCGEYFKCICDAYILEVEHDAHIAKCDMYERCICTDFVPKSDIHEHQQTECHMFKRCVGCKKKYASTMDGYIAHLQSCPSLVMTLGLSTK